MDRPPKPEHREISFWNLRQEVDALWPEIKEALRHTVTRAEFMHGPTVELLEDELSEYLGIKNVMAVATGADAAYIALQSCDIALGDEVVTNPFAGIGIMEAIVRCRGTPVFADVDEDTLMMSRKALNNAITHRTRAIVPIYMTGQPQDADEALALAKNCGARLIEDITQAFGGFYSESKRVGTAGSAGIVSCHVGNIFGCYGDGGLIATDDHYMNVRAREIRQKGHKPEYYSDEILHRFRMDDLQAAVLRVKLKHLDAHNEKRRHVASLYYSGLHGLQSIFLPKHVPEGNPVPGKFLIRLLRGDRTSLLHALQTSGIDARRQYSLVARKAYWVGEHHASTICPVARQVAEQLIMLPISPYLSDEDVNYVCAVLRQILS